jgi:hypothetical protein
MSYCGVEILGRVMIDVHQHVRTIQWLHNATQLFAVCRDSNSSSGVCSGSNSTTSSDCINSSVIVVVTFIDT